MAGVAGFTRIVLILALTGNAALRHYAKSLTAMEGGNADFAGA